VGATEQTHQLFLGEPLQLLDGVHPDATETLGRCWPHARDDSHLHGSQQVLLHPRSDHHQPVGFVEIAGDLRDQLRGPDAHRPRYAAGCVADPRLQLASQGAHRGDREVRQVRGDEVDEGLVQ
jgi:hypothetical protein